MGIQDLSYQKLQAIRKRGTPYAPFTGSGLPSQVIKKLNIQMTTAKKAQLQVGAAKAITGYLSIMEMRETERGLRTAGVVIEETRHGKIIPIITQSGTGLEVQRKILTGAAEATGATTVTLADESGHAALMDLKVAGLMEDIVELKENPTILYREPPKMPGFGLPSWLKLPDFGRKLRAIIAGVGVGVGLLIIIGIVAFVFLKGKK